MSHISAEAKLSTLARLGPADHGRPMTFEEYMRGDYRQGYHYELIDGRLYVSPEANLPQDLVEQWLLAKVFGFSKKHAAIINYVTNKARVFVPDRPGLTAPEPDLAAFRNFPLHLAYSRLRWQDFSPILVGEVLSLGDPGKDLVRNVELYWQVPSIQEYWLFDTRENPEKPVMIVRRRRRKKWDLRELNYREVYTTALLPGFRLLIDPRS
jgi:Uma2 family endonuclease